MKMKMETEYEKNSRIRRCIDEMDEIQILHSNEYIDNFFKSNGFSLVYKEEMNSASTTLTTNESKLGFQRGAANFINVFYGGW